MGRITHDRTTMQIVVPTKAYDALREFAQARSQAEGKSVFISDVVREALAQYFDEQQPSSQALTFNVDRGGYRGKSRKSPSRRIRRINLIDFSTAHHRRKEPTGT